MKLPKMRHLTLERLREQKGLSREVASKLIGIKRKTLEDIEEYRIIPKVEDVCIILKMLGLGYIELVYLVYEDIIKKYNP